MKWEVLSNAASQAFRLKLLHKRPQVAVIDFLCRLDSAKHRGMVALAIPSDCSGKGNQFETAEKKRTRFVE